MRCSRSRRLSYGSGVLILGLPDNETDGQTEDETDAENGARGRRQSRDSGVSDDGDATDADEDDGKPPLAIPEQGPEREKMERSATRIQAIWRGHITRAEFIRRRDSELQLQDLLKDMQESELNTIKVAFSVFEEVENKVPTEQVQHLIVLAGPRGVV